MGDLLEGFAVCDLEFDLLMAARGKAYGEDGIAAFCSAVVEDYLCLILALVCEYET